MNTPILTRESASISSRLPSIENGGIRSRGRHGDRENRENGERALLTERGIGRLGDGVKCCLGARAQGSWGALELHGTKAKRG